MFDNDTYEEHVMAFRKINSTKAQELLSNGELVAVYVGRETCPYCRKFAKKLSDLKKDIKGTIYYVDSSNSSDYELNEFRDKYRIRTVPGFVVSKNKEVEVRCDSSMPEDEILDMLNN